MPSNRAEGNATCLRMTIILHQQHWSGNSKNHLRPSGPPNSEAMHCRPHWREPQVLPMSVTVTHRGGKVIPNKKKRMQISQTLHWKSGDNKILPIFRKVLWDCQFQPHLKEMPASGCTVHQRDWVLWVSEIEIIWKIRMLCLFAQILMGDTLKSQDLPLSQTIPAKKA